MNTLKNKVIIKITKKGIREYGPNGMPISGTAKVITDWDVKTDTMVIHIITDEDTKIVHRL
jgi:hypothetical protein